MRFRILFVLSLATFFAVPLAAEAAFPFFGPIIPQSSAQCAAGWGLVMVVINNIISFLITIAIVFVAPLMIAYSGFLFVVNPVNAGGIEKAKSILTHTIVGIVIALAGWLIVDAIMAVLYNRGAPEFGQTWQSLVTGSGKECIPIPTSLSQVPPVGPPPGIGIGPPTAFTFDPGIEAQMATASGALTQLLSCMSQRVPAGVGRISSISDSVIISGQRTFQYCATNGSQNTSAPRCAHTRNSCHYGGSGRCNGTSYAVDFGDEQNIAVLRTAAQACGARTLDEGNHLHVSVGADNGCECDMTLPPPTNPPPGTPPPGERRTDWPPSTVVLDPARIQYGPLRTSPTKYGQEYFFAYEVPADIPLSKFEVITAEMPGTISGQTTTTVYSPDGYVVAGPGRGISVFTKVEVNNPVPGVYHIVIFQDDWDVAEFGDESAFILQIPRRTR